MSSDSLKLLRAAAYAAEKHSEQRRKDVAASPYINHPIAVATTLADVGGVTDVVLLAAALLHDTVEDTAASPDEIRELFGDDVHDLVAEVTDDRSLPKQQRKRLQAERAPGRSARAKQLKIADKICNISDIDSASPVGWDQMRKLEYLQWAELVVNGCRGVNPSLDQRFDQALDRARQRLNASP